MFELLVWSVVVGVLFVSLRVISPARSGTPPIVFAVAAA
jgi:hypothetical protein